MHVQLSSGARSLCFGLRLLYFVYVRSKGSGETVQMCTDLSDPFLLTNRINTKILCACPNVDTIDIVCPFVNYM